MVLNCSGENTKAGCDADAGKLKEYTMTTSPRNSALMRILILVAILASAMPVQGQGQADKQHLARSERPATTKKLRWGKSPDTRGTMDVLWTCAFTMFLSSWSTLCLNVPSPKDSALAVMHRRVWITCLCFLGPEFITFVAAGQWRSARISVRLYRESGIESLAGWTMKHGFFADMGGYMLHSPDFPPFPVDAKQLLFLIQAGFVRPPNLNQKIIEDRNKVDGLLRVIVVCQVLYFCATTAGRAATGLAITCLELTTGAFIICTLTTMCFWYRKPADVLTSEPIITETKMSIIVLAAVRHFEASSEKINVTRYGSSRVREGQYMHCTPLDFLSRQEWHWSINWSNWINILRRMRIDFAPKCFPVDRFENTKFLYLPRGLFAACIGIATMYSAVFVAAWNYEFPTPTERLLWRVASLVVIGTALMFPIFCELGFEYYPKFQRRLATGRNKQGDQNTSVVISHSTEREVWQRLQRAATRVRNNSVSRNPAFDAPLKVLLPVYLSAFLFCMARTYIILADLIEFRSLPASAYSSVEWMGLLPGI